MHYFCLQALVKLKARYKKEAQNSKEAAYEAEATEEYKLREELDALPKPGSSEGRSKQKTPVLGRKRKAALQTDAIPAESQAIKKQKGGTLAPG